MAGTVVLMPEKPEAPAESEPTVTVRLTKKSARLLRVLAAWSDQTTAEWFTENLDGQLEEMLDRKQIERQAEKKKK